MPSRIATLSFSVLLFGFWVAADSAIANPTQLTFSSATDFHPSWTADGQYIVFQSNRNGTNEIFKMPAGGGPPTPLTSGVDDIHPEVSPDGTRVAFVRNPTGHIWTVPVGGGAATQVTTIIPAPGWEPAWTADGGVIFFSVGESSWNIYKVASGGGQAAPVLTSSIDELNPHFSSDGLWMSLGFRIGNYNTGESPANDPENYVPITFETENTVASDYSPDGTKLLLASRRNGGQDLELWELDRVTQELTQVTFDGPVTTLDPGCLGEYSPDGTKIAYHSRRLTNEYNIWVLDLLAPPEPENTLSVGDGNGQPGTNVTIPVSLTSEQPVAALELKIRDVPELLSAVSVTTVGRASSMSVSFSESGGLVHALVYDAAGGLIQVGTGLILDVEFTVSAAAMSGDFSDLLLEDVVMSDPDGMAAVVTLEDGLFVVGRRTGDINGDNQVDVGDLVRLVEIILGQGAPPIAEELAAADCNEDTDINALDVTCLVNLILGEGSAPGRLDLAQASVEWEVTMAEPIKGIQITGSDGRMCEWVDGPPFEVHEGWRADGRSVLLAFDPGGKSWAPGSKYRLRAPEELGEIRAYGTGGRRLRVQRHGQELHIGSQPTGLRVIAARPNPFRAQTQILFEAPDAGEATIGVFDVSGARVGEISRMPVVAGSNFLEWGATARAGGKLPAGLYLVRIELAGESATARVVHLGS